MTKHALVTIVIAAVISSGVGFAFGRVSQPELARAGDAQVETQLRDIEAAVVKIKKQIGTGGILDYGSVLYYLKRIDPRVFEICLAVDANKCT